MNLVFHTFKKDLRRLWPAVLITFGLLTELTRLDCWRIDWLAAPAEGWFNLLLPLAWACLIALLVQQESLVGDRQFWITWPYRWHTLLGSKALFVLIFVHLPTLIADSVILAFHGFRPGEYILRLLWKQILLAATITVPALGLATLFEGISAFLLAAIIITGAVAYLAGEYEPLRGPWLQTDNNGGVLAACVIALTAGVIILVQYARRRTAPSRIAGAGAMVLAALLFGYLPPAANARIQTALHPGIADISLHLLTTRPELPPSLISSRSGADIVQIALPVGVSGVSGNQDVRFNSLFVEMDAPDSQRYRTPTAAARRDMKQIDFDGFAFPYRQRPSWLLLRLRRSVLDKIRGAVTIRAAFEATLHETGQTAWMPVGATQMVAGVGRCSSVLIESPNVYQESMLKVLCESPNPISTGTGVRLWQPETGEEWKHNLGDSAPSASGFRQSFLSPLNRLQTFFQLFSDPRDRTPGDRWLVPRKAVANAKLAITPDMITAWATVDFEVQNINLRDYVFNSLR